VWDGDRDCDEDGKGDCAEMVTAAERGETERVTVTERVIVTVTYSRELQ
jgi:hypothetical protein